MANRSRKTKGNPPGYGNFKIIGRFYDVLYKVDWVIYMDDTYNDLWTNYKVVSVQAVSAKSANYALSYNKTERRLTGDGAARMFLYMPHLWEWFFDVSKIDPVFYGVEKHKSIRDFAYDFISKN